MISSDSRLASRELCEAKQRTPSRNVSFREGDFSFCHFVKRKAKSFLMGYSARAASIRPVY